jgi:prepilin-type N-terminal cleavage/methylation domain-containing protein
MRCRTPQGARRSAAGRRGFTLIELAVVIVVVGVVATIALTNFMRFRTRATYASCLTNQRHVLESSLLYVSLTSPGTITFDVDQLTAGGYLSSEVAECPKSTAHTFNDYTIHINSNQVTEIDCKIEPAEHHWDVR